MTIQRFILRATRAGDLVDTWQYADPREAEANVTTMAVKYADIRDLKVRLVGCYPKEGTWT